MTKNSLTKCFALRQALRFNHHSSPGISRFTLTLGKSVLGGRNTSSWTLRILFWLLSFVSFVDFSEILKASHWIHYKLTLYISMVSIKYKIATYLCCKKIMLCTLQILTQTAKDSSSRLLPSANTQTWHILSVTIMSFTSVAGLLW